MTPNVHTHKQHTFISDSSGVVKFCSLRGEGRWVWEGLLKNGVRMKYIIIVGYIEFKFLLTYNIHVIYNYFDMDKSQSIIICTTMLLSFLFF